MAIPLSAITNSAQFKALDPSEQARAIQVAIESGQVQDDRGQTPVQAAPNPRGFLDKFDRQLKGAPMGISNSAARTTAGTAKLLGADISPEFMSALEPREGEELGNVAGDIGQTFAGGAALKIPAFAASKLPGLRGAILRAAEQGTKAAASSGALTGLQTGGDTTRMKRDATAGGGMAAVLSGLGSAGTGMGRWLAKTPFRAANPIQKDVLENSLLDKALGGIKPRNLESISGMTAPVRKATGAAKAEALKASPNAEGYTFLDTMAKPRAQFAFPKTPDKMLDPRNGNFFKKSAPKLDAAILPDYQTAQGDIDTLVRRWVRAKGGEKGMSVENIDAMRRMLDKRVKFSKTQKDTNAQEVYRTYSDSLRNLLHSHDGGKLDAPIKASQRAIVEDEMVNKALQASMSPGGNVLKGADFRTGMGAATALTSLSPQAIATTMTLGKPMQTGWLLNRAGQASNILSTAPAVRGVQSAIQPKSKKKPNRN